MFSLLLFAGCSSSSGSKADAVKNSVQNSAEVAKPADKVNVPVFNADSAYNFVAAQVAFGPRVPNSDGRKSCGDYLEAKLA